ncbi:MAG: hypothetical protein GY756_00945 [bacterium]|nr:hypothetical protein [bacterium]
MNRLGLLSIVKNHYVIIGIIIVGILFLILIVKVILNKTKGKDKSKFFKNFNIKNIFRRNKYKKCFNAFKYHLTLKLKLSIFNKKHYLYINIANDLFVNSCTDVESYSYEYYPDYMPDNVYNFYLTNNIFISEIKKEAIIDNDAINNKHLLKFWKAFFSHQKPTVLISIDYRNIIEKGSSKTTELNLAIRKKLNILYQAIKQPVNVYFCVSNININKGYDKFIDFIEHHGFDYYVLSDDYKKIPEKFNNKLTEISLGISGILTRNKNIYNAANAIDIIQILNGINSNLKTWLDKIAFNDGILTPPNIKGLTISSYSKSLNPFELLYSKPKLNYKRRNIIITVAAIILIYLVGKSAFSTYVIASNAHNSIFLNGENNKIVGENLNLSRKIINNSLDVLSSSSSKLNSSVWTLLYPNSISLNSTRHLVADQIYNFILLPELKKTTNAEKVLFYIFLIKSNSSDSLKNYIENNVAKWSAELNIDKHIIKAYLLFNYKSRLKTFKGATAYTGIQNFSISSDQYKYLYNLYTTYSKSDSIDIDDINNFLDYFYSYYNRRITIDVILNKYYPLIRSNMTTPINEFVENYYYFLNTKNMNGNFAVNDLLKNIDVFDKVDYTIPDNVNSFASLMAELNKIVNASYKKTDKKTFSTESVNTPISERNWRQIVAVAKINTLLEKYYNNPLNAQSFFSKNEENMFLPITLNYSNNGSFMFTGKYYIPGIYTKLAVESALEPSLKEFKALLKKLKHIGIKTDFLEYKYNQNLKQYVANYKNSYIKLISNFSYSVSSATQLNLFLNTLSNPQSPLLKLINIVKDNTSFKIDKDNVFMTPVTDKFKSYTHLLKNPDKNELNNESLQIYFNILQQVSYDIDSSSNKQKSNDAYIQLRSQLSKLGKIAMNITLDKKDSYLNIVDAWLDNINMPSDLRAPFIKPITEIYNFGSMDLRNKLNLLWYKDMQSMINSQRSFFPFSPNSVHSADPIILSSLFSPSGSFWQEFNKYYKPFLSYVNGTWKIKNIPYTQSLISADILNEINKVNTMTKALWDDNSNPKAILVDISPTLISDKKMPEKAIIKMTYLNASGNEIIGINSSPIWKQSSINWWKNSISSVGVQMSDGTSFNTPEVQQSFSFYRLLKQAEFNKLTKSYDWTIDIIGENNNSTEVGFKFKQNPWSLFSI